MKTKKTRRNTWTNIDWSQYPLGEEPNYKIAEMVGCSKSTVQKAMANLGIKPYRGWVKRPKRPMVPRCPECGKVVDEKSFDDRCNKKKLCRECWCGPYEREWRHPMRQSSLADAGSV